MNNFYVNNFLGGVNQSKNAAFINFNESPNTINADIEDGLLSTCKGYSKYSNACLNVPVDSIGGNYIGDNGEVLAAANNSIYTLTDAFRSILDSYNTDNFDFINFEYKGNKALIFANGVDNLKVYDGTSVKTLLDRRPVYDVKTGELTGYIDANGATHTTEADITTYAPKGKFIEMYKDRVFLAGDSSNPNRVYYSTAGVNGADIEDWTYPTEEGEANMHGGWEDFPTWDGGKIIGLKMLFGEITIFKNKQIIQLFGTYPGNYEQRVLFTSNGTISDKSICFGNNRALFLDVDGIYAYDGVNTQMISDKIKETFSKLNKNILDKSVAVFHNNVYYLAVPYDLSSVNNMLIMYDTIHGTFKIRKGININTFLEFGHDLFFANDSGYVYVFDESYSFDGTQINMHYESPIYDGRAKNVRKYAEYLYFNGYGSGSVSITLRTEKKPVTRVFALTDTNTEYKRRINNSGRNMQIIIENIAGSEVHIGSPTVTLEFDED